LEVTANERINSDYIWRVLEWARKAAGITKLGESGKPCSVHSLRDTYARKMLEASRHPQWVQESIGHSDLELTMNVYGPWSKDTRVAEASRES
jgi:integrase